MQKQDAFGGIRRFILRNIMFIMRLSQFGYFFRFYRKKSLWIFFRGNINAITGFSKIKTGNNDIFTNFYTSNSMRVNAADNVSYR